MAIVICVAIIDGGMKNRNLFNLGKIRIVDNFLIAVVSSYAPPAIHSATANQILYSKFHHCIVVLISKIKLNFFIKV